MAKKTQKKTCQLCQKKVTELITDTGFGICQKCDDKIKAKIKTDKTSKPSEAVKVSKEEMEKNKEESDTKIKKLRKDKKKKERKVYSTIYLIGSEKNIKDASKKQEKKLEKKQKRIDRLKEKILKVEEKLSKLQDKKNLAEQKFSQSKPMTIRNKEYVEGLKALKTFKVENKKSSPDKIKLYGVKSDGSRVIKVGDAWYQDRSSPILKDEVKIFPQQAGKITERKMKRKILRALEEK